VNDSVIATRETTQRSKYKYYRRKNRNIDPEMRKAGKSSATVSGGLQTTYIQSLAQYLREVKNHSQVE